MTSKAIISTGNPELDSKMGGGLPLGSLVLIEGSSAAGKSVLAQQILHGALFHQYTAALFTSENSVRSLVSQMQSIDLDILDFLLLGRFRVYPMALTQLGTEAPTVLIDAIRKESHRQMIVIDSFTSAISENSTPQNILHFFEQCKKLCTQNITIIITLHSASVKQELVSPIRSMCDAHLQLRTQQDAQRLIKTLEVTKIRGASGVTGSIVGFEVEPGWGMRLIPISKARG
ncbi:MAG: ATPase domain-containing protein [Anaerolineae bacterium]